MPRSFLRPPSESERRARYRVRLLESPSLESGGVRHGAPEARELLSWDDIERVVVAEVGEPEGVRTIVCDLVRRAFGGGYRAHRLDADPGEPAQALARDLERGLGPKASGALKSLAGDGLATQWFPDLASFEEEALAELERGE
jgi:hypothetical protein